MPDKKKKTPQTIRASAETMGAFKKYAKGFKNQDEALMDLLKKAGCGDSDAPMSELPGAEISVEEDWNAELEKSFLVFSEMVCHTKQSVRELLLKTLQIKDRQMMETQRECDRLKAQNKNLQAKIKTKAPSESEHIEKVGLTDFLKVKTSASLRLSFLCVKTEELFDFVVIPTKSNISRLYWY